MSNLDNNVNINNTGRAYAPKLKKGDDAKPQPVLEETIVESLNDGTMAADTYGRILVKQAGKTENAEMVKAVQDAIEFYVNNPTIAQAAVKAGDDACELLSALDIENSYEQACSGSLDAAYSKGHV